MEETRMKGVKRWMKEKQIYRIKGATARQSPQLRSCPDGSGSIEFAKHSRTDCRSSGGGVPV